MNLTPLIPAAAIAFSIAWADDKPWERHVIDRSSLAAPSIGAEPPTARLTNGVLTAAVYLPDAENGYYRGSRFDWSGMISSVESDGHRFFGEWKPAPQPLATDNVVGTAGEFGMESPLGYDEAAPGEFFYKIGVGKLLRPDAEPYAFHRPYAVTPLPWKITRGDRWIKFTQRLPEENGWGYVYSKGITLHPRKPEFTIRHTLKNSGSKEILTDYYCHNFVVFDSRPLDPGTQVHLDFELWDSSPIREIAIIEGKTIRLASPLPEGKSLFRRFEIIPPGGGKTIVFENPETGTALRINSDTTPDKVVFYGIGKSVCIEPFIGIRLAPGEKLTWKDRYSFGPAEQ